MSIFYQSLGLRGKRILAQVNLLTVGSKWLGTLLGSISLSPELRDV